MTRRKSVLALFISISFVGCTGTDMVDEGDGPDGDGRIEIMPGAMALIIGNSFTYTARYADEDDMEVEASFTWTTSAPGVAEVSGGTVSAVSKGQTGIRAEVGTVVSDPVTVTVVEDETSVAYIVVSPTSASTSEQGQVQFSAEVTNIDGGTWESFM